MLTNILVYSVVLELHAINERQLTIDGRLSRQNNDDELQVLVLVCQVFEHGLYLVCPCCIHAEARLGDDWHASVIRDAA